MRTANRQTPTQWTAAWLLLGAAALPTTPPDLAPAAAQPGCDSDRPVSPEPPPAESAVEPRAERPASQRDR